MKILEELPPRDLGTLNLEDLLAELVASIILDTKLRSISESDPEIYLDKKISKMFSKKVLANARYRVNILSCIRSYKEPGVDRLRALFLEGDMRTKIILTKDSVRYFLDDAMATYEAMLSRPDLPLAERNFMEDYLRRARNGDWIDLLP